MGDTHIAGGISFNNGNLSGHKYDVIPGDGNHPVNSVTWYSAIRFANWFGHGQGNDDTETGAFTLAPLGPGGVPINGDSPTRNSGATVFLPSESEWYKAAYYNSATSSYFQFPTSTNTLPTASGPTALPNHANYDSVVANPTDVGAYSSTKSPYGAFDMGGNVLNWNEAFTDLGFETTRGFGGAAFYSPSDYLHSSSTMGSVMPEGPALYGIGFRVAETPEPSSLVLAAFGFIGLAAWGWRRRKTLCRS